MEGKKSVKALFFSCARKDRGSSKYYITPCYKSQEKIYTNITQKSVSQFVQLFF
nr:MAG TPA: hypothetical protein [Caudoviricetes sp.]